MCYEAFFAAGGGPLNSYSYSPTSIFIPSQMVFTKVIGVSDFLQIALTEADKWANLFVPLGLIVIFGGVAIGKFK